MFISSNSWDFATKSLAQGVVYRTRSFGSPVRQARGVSRRGAKLYWPKVWAGFPTWIKWILNVLTSCSHAGGCDCQREFGVRLVDQ